MVNHIPVVCILSVKHAHKGVLYASFMATVTCRASHHWLGMGCSMPLQYSQANQLCRETCVLSDRKLPLKGTAHHGFGTPQYHVTHDVTPTVDQGGPKTAFRNTENAVADGIRYTSRKSVVCQ